MIQHKDSHVDHNLTPGQLAYILGAFAGRDAFFVETITLPADLGTVLNGLYGAEEGDHVFRADDGGEVMGGGRVSAPIYFAPIYEATRAGRAWKSRMVNLPMRCTRLVTVVAGPHDGAPCVLFTAYGGRAAPKEPGDLLANPPMAVWRDRDEKQLRESEAFWRNHALSALTPGRRGMLPVAAGSLPYAFRGCTVRVESSDIVYHGADGTSDLLPECMWSAVEWL